MNQKKLTVGYSCKCSYSSYSGTESTRPKITMEGKWLEELGFHIGDKLTVEYESGIIKIIPAPVEAPMCVAEKPGPYTSRKSKKVR